MSFQKIPAGTRGNKTMKLNPFTRLMVRLMQRVHRLQGDKFMGMDLLYLTTIGARSGQERRVALSRFAEGDGWLVLASAGGAKEQPAWYHNLAAHPEQIWAEVAGKKIRVTAEQLEGEAYDATWKRITTDQPRYNGYQSKTDRRIPIIKLTPA
ncbi:nitroreductase/quinone reductase family protein [Nocardia sp. NPDC127526]|uniref:nitroreductase/quinone reductase family protein n=1 Tax=Nocardia sp. NPDC127526 TaxID=3345393 RepID=UPI00362A5DC1